jgi:hypothetical protein
MPETGFGGAGGGVCVVKVKLTIGFAGGAALVKVVLLWSSTAFLQVAGRGRTQVASNGLGVAREGWGCHPEHDLEKWVSVFRSDHAQRRPRARNAEPSEGGSSQGPPFLPLNPKFLCFPIWLSVYPELGISYGPYLPAPSGGGGYMCNHQHVGIGREDASARRAPRRPVLALVCSSLRSHR